MKDKPLLWWHTVVLDISEHYPFYLMSGGLKQDNDRWFTIVVCLLHQACQAGRGASLQVSVTDRCLLLYSGLTQGQGHTVRHPLLFVFLSQILA